jgi:hypothetical protein
MNVTSASSSVLKRVRRIPGIRGQGLSIELWQYHTKPSDFKSMRCEREVNPAQAERQAWQHVLSQAPQENT